jgi:curved DNA-binding protein CbpA
VPQPFDPYHTLGIQPSAGEDEIKRAYRALAKRYHPDRVPTDRREWARTRMAYINVAYETLNDPVRRDQFDRNHGYVPSKQPQSKAAPPSRQRPLRGRESLRRGRVERQRFATLSGAVLLGIATVTALSWFRLLNLDPATRCAWAIVLGVGTVLVLAALRLTEL